VSAKKENKLFLVRNTRDLLTYQIKDLHKLLSRADKA